MKRLKKERNKFLKCLSTGMSRILVFSNIMLPALKYINVNSLKTNTL